MASAIAFPARSYRWKDYKQDVVTIEVNQTYHERTWTIYAIRLVIEDLNVTHSVSFELSGRGGDVLAQYDSIDNATLDGAAFPTVAASFTVPAQDFTITIGWNGTSATVVFHYVTQVAEEIPPDPALMALSLALREFGFTVIHLGVAILFTILLHFVYLWNKHLHKPDLLNPLYLVLALATPIVNVLRPLGTGIVSIPMGHNDDWTRVNVSLTEIVVEHYRNVDTLPTIHTFTHYATNPYFTMQWVLLGIAACVLLILTAKGKLHLSLGLLMIAAVVYLQMVIPYNVISGYLSRVYGETAITVYPPASLIALFGFILLTVQVLVTEIPPWLAKRRAPPMQVDEGVPKSIMQHQAIINALIARYDPLVILLSIFPPIVMIVGRFDVVLNGFFYYIDIYATHYYWAVSPLYLHHSALILIPLSAIPAILCNHDRLPLWVFLISSIAVYAIVVWTYLPAMPIIPIPVMPLFALPLLRIKSILTRASLSSLQS